MKRITINGTECEVTGDSLEAVLAERGWSGEGVIAELNGAIIGRDAPRAEVAICAGDCLNLFRIVAGG